MPPTVSLSTTVSRYHVVVLNQNFGEAAPHGFMASCCTKPPPQGGRLQLCVTILQTLLLLRGLVSSSVILREPADTGPLKKCPFPLYLMVNSFYLAVTDSYNPTFITFQSFILHTISLSSTVCPTLSKQKLGSSLFYIHLQLSQIGCAQRL